MNVRAATLEEIDHVSNLSQFVGNVPLCPWQSSAALLLDGKDIVGFAATNLQHHAAGSWVKEKYRGKGHTYEMRKALENELRRQGVHFYFSVPNSDFEQELFAKYGPVEDRLAQVKRL